MRHAPVALALILAGAAPAAVPYYTSASIVKASDGSPGPFAPNSILSIYGTGLAISAETLTANDIQGGYMPTQLNYTQVFVDNVPAPLFYVSASQINFLMPADQSTGDTQIRVAMLGNSGPVVTVGVGPAEPALFSTPGGYAIATHADASLITPDSPAHPWEIIVVWATGLGKTQSNPLTGEIPQYPSAITATNLQVSIGGFVLTPDLIKYAGLTPGFAGLYQINIGLPGSPCSDPEIRVAIGDQSTPPGLKLACQ